MWKFWGKAQCLNSFERFDQNYLETAPFHKISQQEIRWSYGIFRSESIGNEDVRQKWRVCDSFYWYLLKHVFSYFSYTFTPPRSPRLIEHPPIYWYLAIFPDNTFIFSNQFSSSPSSIFMHLFSTICNYYISLFDWRTVFIKIRKLIFFNFEPLSIFHVLNQSFPSKSSIYLDSP